MGKLRNLAFVLVVISTILAVSMPSLQGTSSTRILAADAGDSWTTPVNISQTSWEASASSFGGGLTADPQGNIHIVYTVYDGVDDDTREVF